jgi:hypothetical protein
MQDLRSFENPAQEFFMIDENPFTEPTPLSDQHTGSESHEILVPEPSSAATYGNE